MYSLKLAVLLGLGKGMDRLPEIQVSIGRILIYYHMYLPPEVIIEKCQTMNWYTKSAVAKDPKSMVK